MADEAHQSPFTADINKAANQDMAVFNFSGVSGIKLE
jgi:hypothetical protein